MGSHRLCMQSRHTESDLPLAPTRRGRPMITLALCTGELIALHWDAATTLICRRQRIVSVDLLDAERGDIHRLAFSAEQRGGPGLRP